MLINDNNLFNIITDKLKVYSADHKMNLEDTAFILSFSGGIDSSVMASLILEIRNQYNFRLAFVHFNHNVHFKSKEMEQYCKKYCNDNKVDFYCHNLFFKTKNNFEACARKKRYHILNEMAHDYSYDCIITAHHQEDQLETVYMKNIDGSDWISQIGIRERMGKIYRPLLDISKEEIILYANQFHVKWITDQTNSDLSIRRNKIRYIELPKAYKNNLLLKNHLLGICRQSVQKYEETIKKIKKEAIKIIQRSSKNYIEMDREKIKKYKLEELKLFLYTIIVPRLMIKLTKKTRGFWSEFKKFIRKSSTGAIFRIDSLTCIINRNQIIIINHYEKFMTHKKKDLYNGVFWYPRYFKIHNNIKKDTTLSKNVVSISNLLYKKGLFIRSWNHGDTIISDTSKQKKLISDIFIKNKFSIYQKLIQPIVVDNNDTIIWIPGLTCGNIKTKNKERQKVICWE